MQVSLQHIALFSCLNMIILYNLIFVLQIASWYYSSTLF